MWGVRAPWERWALLCVNLQFCPFWFGNFPPPPPVPPPPIAAIAQFNVPVKVLQLWRIAAGILADAQMRVIFYTDNKQPTSSGTRPGPGTVAVADTSWVKSPDGREFRVHEDGKPKAPGEIMPARPAFPYGSQVTVYDGEQKVYEGTVQDTGRGHIRHGVLADLWIDVWYPDPATGRRNLKKQTYRVVVTAPTATGATQP